MINQTIRPLPYYNVSGSVDESRLAQALRMEFKPKIERRLPGHHLNGFRNDFIINFIKRHKQKYPYYMRTDIAKFYPTIRHRDLIVAAQVAYRDLLGLDYVPSSFKRKYVGALNNWCKSLPLKRGIPIGSPISAIIAPIMLVPMWLKLKREFGVPFIVYMDDVFVCCEDSRQCALVFAYIENYLAQNYDLTLNMQKTASGQFSRSAVTFCGWRFSGGYAAINDDKIEAFKSRIVEQVKHCKSSNIRAFIKRINHKIDGFGNHYKNGQVAKQFESMDIFIRNIVRHWLRHTENKRSYNNEELRSLGVHSFEVIYQRTHKFAIKKQPTPKVEYNTIQKSTTTDCSAQIILIELAEKINLQLITMVALQRRQLQILQVMCN